VQRRNAATARLSIPWHAELQAERLKWHRLGDNDDNWHYTFGLEENSGWIGHNGQIPGYFTFEVYNPELDATSVGANERGRRMSFK
jgi:hypothetical protein